MPANFPKEERLCSRRLTGSLFKTGTAFSQPPLRTIWMAAPDGYDQPVQLLISVPKHRQKRAVDRNLLRRRIREAYRLNKQPLLESLARSGRRILVSVTYTTTEIMEFGPIQAKIILILQRLIRENEKVTG